MKLRIDTSKYAIFFLSLFVLGLAAILFGVSANEPAIVAIGSSLIGTGIGGSLQRISNKEFNATILNNLQPGFSSRSQDLSQYRTIRYVYHVTKIDEEFIWRCTQFDFSNFAADNKLIATVITPDPNGAMTSYVYEAGARELRFIMIGNPIESKEMPMVYVFPFAGCGFRGQDSGILFHQTYDATHSISPAILSTQPLYEVDSQEKMTRDKFESFDNAWRKHLKHAPHILPRVLTDLRKRHTSQFTQKDVRATETLVTDLSDEDD